MEAGLDTALMFSGNNEQAVMRHTVRWSSYRADLFMSSTDHRNKYDFYDLTPSLRQINYAFFVI